jgi:subtilase family serine protease
MTTNNEQIHSAHSGYEPQRRFQLTAVELKETLMRNLRKLLLAGLCVLSAVAQSPAPDTWQHLKGHVTAEMTNAPLAGGVPPTTHLSLTVGLVMPNRASLIEAASQVSDPRSPSYRQYVTPEQFADRFGVSQADYQSVLDWAQANHLTATAHKNRFVVTVAGSSADIESALNVHLNYHVRTDGTQFYAPDAEPSLALSVPVEHIGGLENFYRPERARGSGTDGYYQGNDFRNAYAPGMTQRGAGQTIGIFMQDGFAQSDIDGYAAQTGQSFLPVEPVGANAIFSNNGGTLVVGQPTVEGALDIEQALSMAPKAQVVAFLDTPTASLAAMADASDIKQLSSSWFWYNGTTTDENIMLQLGVQGQSFFQASGDGGAYPTGWPSASKYVSPNLDCRQFPGITLVGGTSLDMSDNGASYGTLETVWNWGANRSSSGGPLASVSIPFYQLLIAGQNGASPINRNSPDVSAQGAGMLLFYNGSNYDQKGNLQIWGGTSEATPLWAGFMALVNELAANAGTPHVGFANPALYGIAEDAYQANFHDVVSGCAPNSNGDQYCAGKGYDLATGLGSPQHTLIYTLSGVQAYPLYCQGPLVTSSGNLTPFKWAKEGAGSASPGRGECAWADRAPRGSELDANVISGILNQVANLPAGKFAEIGVYQNPNGKNMEATQVVGLVTPPFNSDPTLP